MNTRTKRTQIRRTATQWQRLITAFESGQDTVNAFCQKNDINPSSFYQWRSKLASSVLTDKADSPAFVPLQTDVRYGRRVLIIIWAKKRII